MYKPEDYSILVSIYLSKYKVIIFKCYLNNKE